MQVAEKSFSQRVAGLSHGDRVRSAVIQKVFRLVGYITFLGQNRRQLNHRFRTHWSLEFHNSTRGAIFDRNACCLVCICEQVGKLFLILHQNILMSNAFGQTIGAVVFQALVNDVLRELSSFYISVCVYVDDILIFAETHSHISLDLVMDLFLSDGNKIIIATGFPRPPTSLLYPNSPLPQKLFSNK